MEQQSLEATDFEKCREKTQKERFLDAIDRIIPWKELCEVIGETGSDPGLLWVVR